MYSPKFINHFMNQVKFLDRSFELPKKKVTKKLQKIPFVTRFTPSASSAIKIINKYWPSVQELHQFQHTRIPRPMLCYRTNKNIRTHLVKSKLTPSLDCVVEATPSKSSHWTIRPRLMYNFIKESDLLTESGCT